MVASVSVTSSTVGGIALRNVLNSIEFVAICDHLLGVGTDDISVYTDSSLAGLGTVDMQAGAAIFFDGIDLDLGVEVSGLVSSTMVELQAITLALECVPPSSSVHLFSDSQAALDVCKSELVKGHSGVVDNKHVNALVVAAAMSEHFLPLHFVHDIFHCVHHAQWEIGSGSRVLVASLHGDVDWRRSSLVWHLDMHMATGSTSKSSADARTYFIKALHH
ncbi:hypothetical protein G9A89_001530 [Geosiphon pyriformis]|nr:hypothetical protein G9A89_001530 [Geosiphon pyriformis]